MSSPIAAIERHPDTGAVSPPHAGAGPCVAVIGPLEGWQWIDLAELWRFRELVYFLAWRDVKVRYKQTVLGIAWAILQPLMMMAVFTVFFGRMAGVPSAGLPYPLFAYAGLLSWTFCATAVTGASNSVVSSERLITKIYFPRLAIPFAAVGAAVVDFAVALSLLFIMMLWYGVSPGVGLFAVPAVFSLIVLMALGVGTLLAALNVAYRDFRYVTPFLLQLWMFATPTVYMQLPESQVGGGLLGSLLALNPMTGLVDAFRTVALGGVIPWSRLGWLTLAPLATFAVGCLYFRRVEDRFADVI
ncbi:ABC transporter permease [Paludisphaera rhizosphaerae]|uniref:ABC transporter permease n=1 Tax=Paludisphaera rhizosphaerae TaxID=2711216 RepID=UPI0013EA8E8D|nr:ABC transporter permease [Paludisphaera rhizosphaerae]